jgi:hypothetical protein
VNPKCQLAFSVLWIAKPAFEAVVAAGLFWRKAYRSFPFFLAYIVAQIMTWCILYPISLKGSSELYFYAFWVTAAVVLGLGFAVIHEVFLDVFRPYHTLKDMGSVLFKWAGLVMLIVAGAVAASSRFSEDEPLVQAIITLQRSMRVVQCGLVLFLLLFSRYLGISWRQRSFGIALGFGSFGGAELAFMALRTGHHVSDVVMNLVNMGSYACATLIWIPYAFSRQVAREAPVTLLKSQRWEQGLGELHPAPAPDSLIPMFESMVDRAFSRTRPHIETDRPAAKPAVAAVTSSTRTA